VCCRRHTLRAQTVASASSAHCASASRCRAAAGAAREPTPAPSTHAHTPSADERCAHAHARAQQGGSNTHQQRALARRIGFQLGGIFDKQTTSSQQQLLGARGQLMHTRQRRRHSIKTPRKPLHRAAPGAARGGGVMGRSSSHKYSSQCACSLHGQAAGPRRARARAVQEGAPPPATGAARRSHAPAGACSGGVCRAAVSRTHGSTHTLQARVGSQRQHGQQQQQQQQQQQTRR
jgi:hypothetical protein